MIERLLELDAAVFRLLNGTLHHPLLDAIFPFVTTQENWYPVLGGLFFAMIIWGGRRGRMAAAMLVVAIALADQLSCTVLKPLVGRVRPCNALPAEEVRLLVRGSKALAFPSAHAANSFAMATVATWRFRRLAPLFFLIAAAVAYSRVYVGVHYPLDVIGGAILGVAVGRAAIWLIAAFVRVWGRWRATRRAVQP